MDERIQQLRSYPLRFNRGATLAECKALEGNLACRLPSDLLALYLDHNGADLNDEDDEESKDLPFRLMPINEVRDLNTLMQEREVAKLGIRLFWTDGNSDYAGLYVEPPLTGYICILNHEEADLSPVYRSVRTFLDYQFQADDEEPGPYGILTEYPRLTPAPVAEIDAQDWEIVQILQPRYESADEPVRTQYAFTMMALTPVDHTAELLAFLQDDDMWIVERACEIIGARRYAPAIPQLGQVVEQGQHNGRMAALWALGYIANDASREQLEHLAATLPSGYQNYVEAALGRGGRRATLRGNKPFWQMLSR